MMNHLTLKPSKLLYSVLLIIVALLTTSPSRAEVTNPEPQSDKYDSGPRHNCAGATTTTEAPLYNRSGGGGQAHEIQYKYELNNNYYEANQRLGIYRIEGDYAEIVAGGNSVGWLHRSSFNNEEFSKAITSCNYQTHLPDDPHTGGLKEEATLKDGIGLPEGTPEGVSAEHFAKALCNLQQFYAEKKRKERYAIVNIPNGFKYRSFLIEVATGKVIRQFDSLKNPKVGCGEYHTRPGIFRLSSEMRKGTKYRSWWGTENIPGFGKVVGPAYMITNVGGNDKKYGGGGNSYWCKAAPTNGTIKAHMNTNMRGPDARGRRFSHGCLITSKQIFREVTMKHAGDALIQNFSPAHTLHPHCANIWGEN